MWLKRDEIVSEKECFGVFRADNYPAKREVNPSVHCQCGSTSFDPRIHFHRRQSGRWKQMNNFPLLAILCMRLSMVLNGISPYIY